MSFRTLWSTLLLGACASTALAQDPPPIRIEGEVPMGEERHFFKEFEVPEGIVEIEVQHDDLSSVNILDWGLDDPNGFRGWGGGNSEPAIVGVEAASRSYIPGPIPAGTWEVVVGKASVEEFPALYEIDIFLRTEATLPPQDRTPYQDPGTLSDEARWYAGDFHVHSRQSGDATPSISATLDVARDIGLDFMMLSEHNTNSGLTLYGGVQPDYPDVLLLPGVEWTSYSGHANAIGATEWVDHKIGTRGATPEDAVDAYLEQGAIFSINHPTVPGGDLCIGCPWELMVDQAKVGGVEAQGGIWIAIDFWEQLVAEGARAPAIGGSDDHRGGLGTGPLDSPIGSPTTMVYAEDLSVDAILEGIREGRTVIRVNGAVDPMLETELSGERMGDTVLADTSTLSVTVTGAVEGQTLRVIKNREVIEEIQITSDPFIHELEVSAPELGEDRYRHQVMTSNTPKTIGSYVWLRAPGSQPMPDAGVPDAGAPDGGTDPSDGSSGCSCGVVSSASYDTGVLFALLASFAWASRRRRST